MSIPPVLSASRARLRGFAAIGRWSGKVGAWHIMADGPDLMQRIPRQAHFVTILAYRPSSKGAQRTIEGPLYWEGDHTKGKHLDTWTICSPLAMVRLWGGFTAHTHTVTAAACETFWRCLPRMNSPTRDRRPAW